MTKLAFTVFCTFVLSTCGSSAFAQTPSLDLGRPGFEMGGRYWYSTGRNAYNYYTDPTPSALISRLTYDGLSAHSGEIFFRGDTTSGLFLKGIVGAGAIGGGNLKDEDFAPYTVPYSQTTSATVGNLSFGSIDLGYSFVRQPHVRVGAFVGYGRWNESATAMGCTQLASSSICTPSLDPALAGIKETDHWDLLRLGLSADVLIFERWKLSADAAYVWARQKALDQHYFTFGSDPSSGKGEGYQFEALVSYQMTEKFTVGVGGRLWHLDTTAIDNVNQLLSYQTQRYGAFVEATWKLN
ncbi:MAG: hypothetical protein EKK41_25700 [Hyphomicrobiales bacterium]|nr:MAG: hypothetical protein EKK41_25700 [Hyphomicrobiales bacterium]